MFDPSTPFGATVTAVVGAAIFCGLQLAFRRIKTINPLSPIGMIVCVVIGTFVALGLAATIVWLWSHVQLT